MKIACGTQLLMVIVSIFSRLKVRLVGSGCYVLCDRYTIMIIIIVKVIKFYVHCNDVYILPTW